MQIKSWSNTEVWCYVWRLRSIDGGCDQTDALAVTLVKSLYNIFGQKIWNTRRYALVANSEDKKI